MELINVLLTVVPLPRPRVEEITDFTMMFWTLDALKGRSCRAYADKLKLEGAAQSRMSRCIGGVIFGMV